MGESMFMQVISADEQRASDDENVTLAAKSLGSIELIRVSQDHSINIHTGAFLAADTTVDLISTMNSGLSQIMLSGHGLIVMQATGFGVLAICSRGSMLKYQLQEGEVRFVDNGHVLAWSSHMPHEIVMGSRRGLYHSAMSGEGVMRKFVGPGTLWVNLLEQPSGSSAHGQQKTGNAAGAIPIFIFFIILIFFVVVVLVALNLDGSAAGGVNARQTRHR